MSVDQADAASSVVVVQRWKRYGRDRAYVKIENRDLGYRDLVTGEVKCPDATDVDAVTRATEDLYGRVHAKTVEDAYRPRHAAFDESALPASVVPDRDLALNTPGQAAWQGAMRWGIGARGEQEVARQLATLGPNWHVLHAIPVGAHDSDIDHVVIGPGGVVTVNTKNHQRAGVWVGGETVKINGFDQPYVRNSRHEASRAGKLLGAVLDDDVDVRGVVAIVGADRGFTVKEQPRDGRVAVVRGAQLCTHLQGFPVQYDADSVARIYEAARHLSTWQPSVARRAEFDDCP